MNTFLNKSNRKQRINMKANKPVIPRNVNLSQNSFPKMRNTRFGYGIFGELLLSIFWRSFCSIRPEIIIKNHEWKSMDLTHNDIFPKKLLDNLLPLFTWKEAIWKRNEMKWKEENWTHLNLSKFTVLYEN